MNHAQAVILAPMSDEDILTLYPKVVRRHLPVLREWAKVGGLIEWSPDRKHWASTSKPSFGVDTVDYRLPVRRIELTGPGGTYSYPEPLREAPAEGMRYCVIGVTAANYTDSYIWANDDIDERALAAGFVHLTREAAEEHARAIILAQGGRV